MLVIFGPMPFQQGKREIIGQHAVPKFGFRLGNGIVGFEDLRNVVLAVQQWIVIRLLTQDFHHMQDDLSVLGVVPILTAVDCLTHARQGP